jgi:uncharacterized protein (UPF0332 family)
MKESSWKDCLEENFARKIIPDRGRAESLIETAEERINFIKNLSQENWNFIFENYYTSLLEFMQALVLIGGYKVLNHFCLGYYLRDFLKREDLYLLFEDLRYKRNSLVYYGNKMDFEIAKQSIEKCRKLIKEIKRVLK